ncbi:MAG: DegV family protein [Actinomycetota bacterium]
MPSTALIVDSTALLTPELVAATGARVVPVTVTVDGVDYTEGVDLDADTFFEMLSAEPRPAVSTAQPAPGRFVAELHEAEAAGAEDAVAVLVGSAFSGTVDAARVAAANGPIPLTVADTGQASFGIGLCAIAAAEAIGAGADAMAAAEVALGLTNQVESVFIVQAVELALASGRFDGTLAAAPATADGDRAAVDAPIPVLRHGPAGLSVVAEVSSLDEAVEAMALVVVEAGWPVRVASGLADRATRPVTEALEARLSAHPLVVDLLRYRVGPSVAANVGAGTAGVFFHPAAG